MMIEALSYVFIFGFYYELKGLSIIGQEIFDISNMQLNICTEFILRMLTLDQVS